jgi:hypothetical protein
MRTQALRIQPNGHKTGEVQLDWEKVWRNPLTDMGKGG